MKLLMVDSISRGGYFNFIYIHQQKDPGKMKDNVRELTLFLGVNVYTYCQRDFDSAVRGLCWLFFCGRVLLIDFLSFQFPTKGSLLLVISIVKVMEGWDSFNVAKKASANEISGTMAEVSSTYIL